jgi:glutathione S-transferase
MTEAAITVWGAASTRAFRVYWALHELGLSYERRPIRARTGETQTDDYGRLNPKRKIPCLEDGDLVLSESAAIVNHLFRAYGAGADVFVPGSAGEQAASDEWCYFVMTELDAHALYLIRRHKYLPEIYGAAPEAVASAEEYFLKQIGAVAPRVAAVGRYLFGDRLGVADILLVTTLDWALNYDIALPAPCLAYRDRAAARPAYAAAQAANAVAD